MEQNYFQYNNLFYKPKEGVAMGSPLSGTLAELYLQRTENNYIKHWIDSEEIYYTITRDMWMIPVLSLIEIQTISMKNKTRRLDYTSRQPYTD